MDRGDAAVIIQRAWRALPFRHADVLQHQRLQQRAANYHNENLCWWVIMTWYEATVASYGTVTHRELEDPDFRAAMVDLADASYAADDQLWGTCREKSGRPRTKRFSLCRRS